MLASELNKSLLTEHTFRAGSNRDITGITNDSRTVQPGWLYAALPGEHTDGHTFIPEAIKNGACAIICSEVPPTPGSDVALFHAADPRKALSEASHQIYGRPSDHLVVIGVTGTDGKTSTCSFIHQLLNRLGHKTGLLSSALLDTGSGVTANLLHQSTPEAPQVHAALRQMVDAGCSHAVVESTSHGLSAKTWRLGHVRFTVSVLTNMSPEHLEFHGTFEQYRHDKANLFRALDYGCYALAGPIAHNDAGKTADPRVGKPVERPVAILNADDPVFPYFKSSTSAQTITYSLAGSADYRSQDLDARPAGSSFVLESPQGHAQVRLSVPGEFNVSNLLAAVASIDQIVDSPIAEIAALADLVEPIPGRMVVLQERPFALVVDFAHTPGSFKSVLPFFRRSTSGRLILVFGSAGERDVQKRHLQGEIADRFADLVFLADEDPRSEDRNQILRQIASGFTRLTRDKELFLIADRREAIKSALQSAERDDTVLLLGKGHETSIIGPDGPAPWNEAEIARDLLHSL